MATQVIPTSSYPDLTFRVTLDSVPFDMRVYWSSFDKSMQIIIADGILGQWYMDLSNADLSINLRGVALTQGRDILEPHGYSQLGGLWISGEGELTFEALGNTHQLVYVPVADKDEFNAQVEALRLQQLSQPEPSPTPDDFTDADVWFDPSDLSTLFQDAAGTIPVTGTGQPVGLMLDKSGNDRHASQATESKRPIFREFEGLSYLECNGSNASMSTGNIDFTFTDQMLAVSGIRKLSDAVTSAMFESSSNSSSIAGSFGLFAPIVGVASYQYRSSGTVPFASVGTGSTEYPAPVSSVIACVSRIAEPSVTIRVDAAQKGSSSGSQGSGNYGNYPLYLFARNNSSLFFSGNFYGLILAGGERDQAYIDKTEQYMAKKTGVTL